MSNSTLAEAINQIVVQAEAQREHEQKQLARDERRRVIFGKARGAFVFLFIATILLFGFHYRMEIQRLVSGELTGASQAEDHMRGVQESAAMGDAVLSEIAR